MSGATRRKQSPQDLLIWVACGGGVMLVGSVWVAVQVGSQIDDLPAPTKNPLGIVLGLAGGTVPWPPSGGLVLGGVLVILLVLLLGGWFLTRKLRGNHKRGDQAAALMGTGKELEAISYGTQRETARRLGVTSTVGFPIADTVYGGQTLYQGVEDVSCDIWGPRQGKTSCRVIPAIVEAPGAVFVTSNKRDVVDATRGVREASGPVWVFDPQNIVHEPSTWWWNPLTYITEEVGGEEVAAEELATVFFKVALPPDARPDPYFTPAGMGLLTNMLLAAALDGMPLTQVGLWVNRSTDRAPVDILERHGFALNSAEYEETIHYPEKQRAGIFGTVKAVMQFLNNRRAQPWYTAQPGEQRPHFSPRDYVRSTGTMYCISKEGKGTTAGLMTALTVAVADAAEKWAERNRGGRMPVPMLFELDELANVCRWPELPNLYSHYGSRGISVMAIFQSWSQMKELYGENGAKKLWGASTVTVIGSGVSDTDFLRTISDRIGDYEAPQVSRSSGSGQKVSYTHSRQRDRIMDVSDLASLPKGRAIVLAAGARPALVRTRPWMVGTKSAQIKASIARFDPDGVSIQLEKGEPEPKPQLS